MAFYFILFKWLFHFTISNKLFLPISPFKELSKVMFVQYISYTTSLQFTNSNYCKFYSSMAFCRSSLLLRKALVGSRREAAASSSYSLQLCGSPNRSDRLRWYSGAEGTTIPAPGYHVNTTPSYMRGSVFWSKDTPITYEDFEMPRPKANEVLIKIKGKVPYYFCY